MPEFITIQFRPGAPYGEALFLIACVVSLLAGRTRRFVVAGLFAALATAIRLEGVLLVIPLVLECLADARERRAKDDPGFDPAYLTLVLPITAWLLYAGALRFVLHLPGDPLTVNEHASGTSFTGYHLSGDDRYALVLFPLLLLLALLGRRWSRLNAVLAVSLPLLLVGMTYKFVAVHWVR